MGACASVAQQEVVWKERHRQRSVTKNYDLAAMLGGWPMKTDRPHVPMLDKSEHHDGTPGGSDFPSMSRTTFMFALPKSTEAAFCIDR